MSFLHTKSLPSEMYLKQKSSISVSSKQPQIRNSPIIVGEQYELAETLALKYGGEHHSGLLAKPDYQTALLSMSGYDGKHAVAALDELHNERSAYPWAGGIQSYNRPSQPSLDLLYAQRGIANPNVENQSAPAYGREMPRTSYAPTGVYQQRAPYAEPAASSDDANVGSLPEIKSFSPVQGAGGSPINIYITADRDVLLAPILVFSVQFGMKRVVATATRLDTSTGSFEYMIFATVPHFTETASTSPKVSVQLQLQEEDGSDAGLLSVGHFEYTSGQFQTSPVTAGRKRKISDADSLSSSTSNYGSYQYAGGVSSPYPPNYQAVDMAGMNRQYASYGRSPNPQKYHAATSAAASTLASQPMIRAPTSASSSWNPAYSSLSGHGPIEGDLQNISSSSSDSNPTLVRTTTLHQSDVVGSTTSSSTSNAFNPYIYPQKAVLKIHGELNSMIEHWTPDECATKRRLVQFTRSQNKSTINATFAPVAPEDRSPNSICISCIWWEERQECFATSVDTIQLLESLVALRFTVEEKNRIRRNLEGFHPETVSKTKADSEEFFKLIMGFPNPKPRNIEKDVKVFPWKILAHALKKIISKYSASYASAAGALSTPRTTMYFSSESPSVNNTRSSSTIEGSYPPTLKSQVTPYVDGSSAPSISSEYTVSPMASQFGADQHGYAQSAYAPYGGRARSGSATQQEAPRQYKRPRANTSGATFYPSAPPPAMSASLARSYSEQPGPNAQHSASGHSVMRLPSLAESYPTNSGVSDPRYTPQEQVTAGMSQSHSNVTDSWSMVPYGISSDVADPENSAVMPDRT